MTQLVLGVNKLRFCRLQNDHHFLMCVSYCLIELEERDLTIVSRHASGIFSLLNASFIIEMLPGKDSGRVCGHP